MISAATPVDENATADNLAMDTAQAISAQTETPEATFSRSG